MKNKCLVVTGDAGFIGSNLIRELSDISKAKQKLGYGPKFKLNIGLEKAIK